MRRSPRLRSLLTRKYAILVFLTPLVIVLDQWTKTIVVKRFHLGETVSLISGFFNFTYVRNTGAAFGILAQADPAFRVPFFVAVPVIALAAIGYVFSKLPPSDIRLSSALSLVIGGAFGNLLDRLTYGYVIDFVDFHWRYEIHFPAFNIADIAICVGVGILMLDLLVQSPPAKERAR